MSKTFRRAAWTTLACGLMTLIGVRSAAQAPASRYDPLDVQYGARIYSNQCAVCHGAGGDQIAGVNLRTGPIRRGVTDNQLRNVITGGIPGTAMPPFKFTPSELTMIVAYVRNMRTFEDDGLPTGDAAKGKAIFEGAGLCTSCHRVNGNGPLLAPDLSDIGNVRSAAALTKTLLDPSANILPVNRSVRAVTRDGRKINGRRLNEDTYSVQVMDEGGRLMSLDKASLREYEVVLTSTMPSYKEKFSAQDTADVVAYLLTLKGLN
jgi:putative heme-binding domain-containing protein